MSQYLESENEKEKKRKCQIYVVYKYSSPGRGSSARKFT